MTIRELAKNWIEHADISPVPEIDLDTAKAYISWLDQNIDLPKDLNPQEFMEQWNDIIRTCSPEE